MKKLLLTGIAAMLMATSAAHATERLPEHMLGQWCPLGAVETNVIYVRAPECSGATIFWQTGYDKYEQTCRYISIRQSKNPGVYQIIARCADDKENGSWVESFDMFMYKRELNVANRKLHDRRLNDLARWYV
jgi:hypothetical protein